MKQILIFLLFLPFTGIAQVEKMPVYDSATYYRMQIILMQHKLLDSMRKTDEYKHAIERINYYRGKSDGYLAFVLFGDVAKTDFERFNSSITPDGFPPITGPIYRIGMGTTTKSGRIQIDIFYFALGIAKGSSKGNEHITAMFSNGFIVDIGYDLVKSKEINLYPYIGLSGRNASIYYDKPSQVNPSFTSIANYMVNNQSTTAYSNRLGYQAGLGLDVVIANFKRAGGMMLFVKAGTNGSIGKEKYKIDGKRYDPGIKYGQWIISAGVKFFGRK